MPDAQSETDRSGNQRVAPAQSKAPGKQPLSADQTAPIFLRNAPAATIGKPAAQEPLGQSSGPSDAPEDREGQASAEAASYLAGKSPSGTTDAPVVPPSAGAGPAEIVVPEAPGKDGPMQVMVAAEVLRRVNRTRQVVSLVSQVIIRSYEEEALLAEACRHLIAFGGYLMAWIGVAEKEPERIVRPVAHAGLESNFLAALKITWSDDLANRSPTSRSVQEQRPYVARNILKEPRYAILRQEAQLHGYTATCALPLQFAQYGLGVLTVHAAEPDAFGPEEVSLLRELANDVAAGVIGLRERARQQDLEEKALNLQIRFASIIDNAREGIFQSTPKGKLLLVNDALVRLLGYGSKQELLAVLPPVILTHLHPDYVESAMEKMFVAEGATPFEARMRKKSGGWIWVDLIAKSVETPEGPIVEGFVQDTTDRHGQEQASARLAAVVDAADDAIIGIDLEGLITDWNAGATRLYGFERDEAVGKPVTKVIVPPEGVDAAVRALAAIGRGERVARFETSRLCKEGEPIHVSVMMTAIFGSDGSVIGSTAVEHDITAVRAAANAQRIREIENLEVARLKGLEGLRRTFISEASHELNTPLTPLRIHVEALGERPDVTPQQREHLVVIERNVLRLANLVKDMLEASRLETGRFELDVEDVPVVTIVNDSIQALAETAVNAGVTLEAGVVTRLLAHVDRNRVSQVLFNLLNNAISFTPKGGRVTVSAALEEDQVVVRVTDTGLGLSAEQIGQLFQPFSRPHEGLGSAAKGTGLGLFISKGIVEQHGGRIWVDSQGPGTGATFCFSLPLAPDVRKGIPSHPEGPSGAATRVVPPKRDMTSPPESKRQP